MTPKEKAEQLLSIMYYTDIEIMSKHCAKQCALLSADEILKVLWHTFKNEIEYTYWQEVKQEIDKL